MMGKVVNFEGSFIFYGSLVSLELIFGDNI